MANIERLNHERKTYADIDSLIPTWTELFKELQQDIGDEYRCSDDPDDDTPGMAVTIGYTPADEWLDKAPSWGRQKRDSSWHYQTGDNSFHGGAYSHANWGVISLYRDSDCHELAKECADQIAEALAY